MVKLKRHAEFSVQRKPQSPGSSYAAVGGEICNEPALRLETVPFLNDITRVAANIPVGVAGAKMMVDDGQG